MIHRLASKDLTVISVGGLLKVVVIMMIQSLEISK